MSNEVQVVETQIHSGEITSPRQMPPSTVTVTPRASEQDLPRVQPPGIKDFLLFIHRGLRGWYALVIVLGLMLGAGGAFLGWRFTHPIYRSEAMIHISSYMPKVYLVSDQNRNDFNTLVQSQRALINSQMVIDKAIQKLSEQGMRIQGDAYKFFASNLKVDIKSEYIQVSVTDKDPNMAWMAATAVVNAYQETYKDPGDAQRLLVMRDDKARFVEQRRAVSEDLEKQVQSLHYGTSDLKPFYETAATHRNRLRVTLDDIDSALAMIAANPAPEAQPAEEQESARSGPWTDEQIAEVDPVMARWLELRGEADSTLKRLMIQGLGSNHPQVREAQQKHDDANVQIEKIRSSPRRLAKAAEAKNPVAALAVQTPKQLTDSRARLQDLYDKVSTQMEFIGNQSHQMEQKEETLRTLKAEDEKLGKQIEALEADERLAHNYKRIEVMGSGTIPIAPDKDLRLPVAAAAGCAGLVMPAGLLVLLSLIRRRFHYSDDTASGVLPKQAALIGILPELEEDNSDMEQMAAAAHSVHQVRVSLMAQARGQSQSYLVTSAISGEGKTSLTMSLGLSFAASRLKTLIIDADLIGRHLTTALEVCEVEGLFETLQDGRLRERVRKLDGNLFVLPAGMAEHGDACSVAPAAIKALLHEARKYFHMVIVDTGPILGSLEATVIAQEVDGVVFTIGRGQQRNLVEKALVRLRSLDANVSGCVFNRAKSSDFSQSAYGSSSHYTKSNKMVLAEHPNARRLNRFGPLVHAVASRMPAMQN